jgi:hypothetical protein
MRRNFGAEMFRVPKVPPNGQSRVTMTGQRWTGTSREATFTHGRMWRDCPARFPLFSSNKPLRRSGKATKNRAESGLCRVFVTQE